MAALTHNIPTPTAPPPPDLPTNESPHRSAGLQVIRRNGAFSPFDAGKITLAITKAFVAVEGSEATASRRIRAAVESMTQLVVDTLSRRAEPGRPIHIEDIQDQVELALMRSGEHKVARAYVLYREERAQERRKREEQEAGVALRRLHVRLSDGLQEPLDEKQLYRDISEACAGLDGVSAESVMSEVRRNLYDGIQLHELGGAQTMAARTLVEQEPNYAYVSARLLLNILRDEALAFLFPRAKSGLQRHRDLDYAEYFPEFIRRGIELDMLDKELANFDLARIASLPRPGLGRRSPLA